jgi:hypothetical protein
MLIPASAALASILVVKSMAGFRPLLESLSMLIIPSQHSPTQSWKPFEKRVNVKNVTKNVENVKKKSGKCGKKRKKNVGKL